MRWLGRTLFVVLLLCAAWWYGHALWQRLSPHRFPPTSSHMDQLKNASTRLTYTLDRVKWMLFAIPAGATSLRVSTHANLPTALVAEPEAEWNYALTYELLNAKGQLETQHVYHHRSRTTRHTHPSTNESTLAAFYLDASLTPTDTRSFVLDLRGFPSAARIRFRLASQDEPLTDVSLSLYARAPVGEHQVDYLWRRLPDDQKQSLANGLVYTIDLLEQPERIQLLKNRWQALGPKGIEGRDYHTRKLYVLENLEPVMPRSQRCQAGSSWMLNTTV